MADELRLQEAPSEPLKGTQRKVTMLDSLVGNGVMRKGPRSVGNFSTGGDHAGSTAREAGKRVTFDLEKSNHDKRVIDTIHSGVIKSKQLTKSLVTLSWHSRPRTIMLVKKRYDPECTAVLISIAKYLAAAGVRVVLEQAVREDDLTVDDLQALKGELVPDDGPATLEEVDLCICIGGDGTILWYASKFPRACPPVLSVGMGSLGFLTTCTEITETILDKLLTEKWQHKVTMRSRLQVSVYDENDVLRSGSTHTVLNEVVLKGVDGMVNLEVYLSDILESEPITNVQGDGLIISTTTGSTAYSMSAGGSMIHPSIPCILLTPICPHSLSFRPVVVSDTVVIHIRVHESARTDVCVFSDGKSLRPEGKEALLLKRGEWAVVRMSPFPVPCICSSGESADWFASIKEGFNWNERKIQKAFAPGAREAQQLEATAPPPVPKLRVARPPAVSSLPRSRHKVRGSSLSPMDDEDELPVVPPKPPPAFDNASVSSEASTTSQGPYDTGLE